MSDRAIADLVPNWDPRWVHDERLRHLTQIPWLARETGLTEDEVRDTMRYGYVPIDHVVRVLRGLGTSLQDLLARKHVDLSVQDFDGLELMWRRHRRGLTVERAAKAARIHEHVARDLESPWAGERTIDELGAYAAALGLSLEEAVALVALDGGPAQRADRRVA